MLIKNTNLLVADPRKYLYIRFIYNKQMNLLTSVILMFEKVYLISKKFITKLDLKIIYCTHFSNIYKTVLQLILFN